MSELATVARPYAKALYSLAQEQHELEGWLTNLSLLSQVCADSKIKMLIESPKLDKEQKVAGLFDIIGDDINSKMFHNFVEVLAENDRLELISSIYEAFKQMVLSQDKTEQATVYSAYPLEDDEFNALIKIIEKHCNVKLAAKLVIEPELIGGFRVEFGDQVLDMSVKSELNSLYQTMIN